MRVLRALQPALSAALAFGCSAKLELGSDLLWSATAEATDLAEWTDGESNAVRLPNADSSVEVSAEASHGGRQALKFTNPANWDNEEDGPALLHDAGPQGDAYYSAWFLLPQDYKLEPSMTLLHLGSRDDASEELFNGEQLQLRSLPNGGYVLLVFHNNAGFLLEPVAIPAPHVAAGRWFHLEARYEAQSSGRLQVWLDGALTYDLAGRPGAAGSHVVLSVCNLAERSTPAPLTLFADDVAISLSRVGPDGHLAFD